MPNIKSAKKRMELSRRWNEANRKKRSSLRTAIKRVRTATTAEEGQTHLRAAVSLLDRAATHRLVHPNRAARVKSQLTRLVATL